MLKEVPKLPFAKRRSIPESEGSTPVVAWGGKRVSAETSRSLLVIKFTTAALNLS